MDESTEQPKGRKAALFGSLIIFAMVALPLWFFMIGPQLRHDRLEENGIRAPGRLIGVDETGTVVNDSPELELVVEFKRKDGTLDTAVTDFVPTLRTIHMYQPGTIVTAAYDPEDPEEITVIDLTTPGPAQAITTSGAAQSSVDSLQRVADSLRREVEALKGR